MHSRTHGAAARSFTLVVLALTSAAFGTSTAAAAPTLRATSGAASTSAGASVTVPTPTSIAGDVLLAAVTARLSPGGKITAPPGWQLVRSDVANGGASLQQAVYSHVAGLSEPASSTWRLSSAVGWSATVLAFAGVDTSAPLVASSGQVTSGSALITAPAVSMTMAGAQLVGFFGNNGRMGTTPPAGMQELTDRAAAGSSTATLESAATNLTSAGSSGVRTAVSAASNSRSVGQLVALRPSGDATPGPPPPPATPDFTVGAAPSAISAVQGSSTSATVSTSATGGFAGTVSLSAPGLPAGATASFSPATVVAGQSSQLTISVGLSTPAGTSAVAISASDGSRVRLASVSLTVTQAGGMPPTVGAALPAPLAQSTGAAFYVATNGADSNAGTLASPWLTVQKALSTLAPGQIAFVRGGVYAQNLELTRAGTAASPITIRSYPGETAVLRPAASSPNYPLLLSPSAAYVRVQGFVIENAVGSSTTNVYVDGADWIELSDCEIRFSQRQGVFVEPTSTRVQILRNRIHDNGNLTNAQQDHGIYIEGSDHLIAGNVIRDQPHGYGIQIYPQALRVTVVSNTIVGNSLGGIVVGSDGGTTASGTLIVNNVLVGNKYGVVTYWGGAVGTGNVARSNLAWNNASGNFSGSGLSYGANTVADPAFVDFAARDLRLGTASPAVDRAEPDYSPSIDLDGRTRPQGAGPDWGAFER